VKDGSLEEHQRRIAALKRKKQPGTIDVAEDILEDVTKFEPHPPPK
jgi:hypothetical protein